MVTKSHRFPRILFGKCRQLNTKDECTCEGVIIKQTNAVVTSLSGTGPRARGWRCALSVATSHPWRSFARQSHLFPFDPAGAGAGAV